jgi:hypothetical protein
VKLGILRRGGLSATGTLVLDADPALSIVDLAAAGGTLTESQKAFREAWLSSRVK